ncbi:short chain dehydrogenase/oxidoreductase-like protein [Geopyxis carbonaria]|nr:short chain dehydrogenase/oxidoreductase-like protein [Geopyxis carbonaria]
MVTNTASPFLANSQANNLRDFDLTGKVIVVTGGGRGLGYTQAEALLDAGATVYALDILDAPIPEFTACAEKHHGRLHYSKLDVRDEAAVRSTIHTIASTNNRLDGLIAAAGILEEVDALKYSSAQFSKILDINVTGVFLSAQACAAEMIRLGNPSGGTICLIASISATIANRGLRMTAYNTSKAAVQQMGRNLASEWGVHNIRVNTLSPGYIMTQMVEKLFETFPERDAEWSAQNMLGRISRPEEYRGVAVFLMSDASTFMTGSDIIVDGGHCAW